MNYKLVKFQPEVLGPRKFSTFQLIHKLPSIIAPFIFKFFSLITVSRVDLVFAQRLEGYYFKTLSSHFGLVLVALGRSRRGKKKKRRWGKKRRTKRSLCIEVLEEVETGGEILDRHLMLATKAQWWRKKTHNVLRYSTEVEDESGARDRHLMLATKTWRQ